MNDATQNPGSTPRLTSLSHGGGCGCKIAPGVLADLLRRSVPLPAFPNLLVGNDTADDAAVYQLNDEQAIVATTDFFMPIVDDPFDFGRIAATNALSDVYAMGGKPILALALVGMPINVLPHEVIAQILKGGESICTEAGIPVAGGHSIDSVEPIYGLAALGIVHPKLVKRNAAARPGDVLILGKPLGVGVLSAALKKERLDAAGYAAMIAATTKLNRPGADLAQLESVHALTDVTGFGLLGHTLELSRGAGLTARIRYADLPWLPGVEAFARAGVFTGASGRNWTGSVSDPECHSSDSSLWSIPESHHVQVTPDGGYLVFSSATDLTAPEDTSTVSQIFRYDAETGELARVSIGQNGFNANGNTDNSNLAVEPIPNQLGGQASGSTAVSEDGSVVFQSANGLTPGALNGQEESYEYERKREGVWQRVQGTYYAQNVYEYRENNVQLISDGRDTTATEGSSSVRLRGMTPSGADIFFETADQLVPQDTDTQRDLYDARIDGGFPAPAVPTSCEENCQGAPGSQPLFGPPSSTTFSGPGNLASPPETKPAPKPKLKPLTRAQKLAKAMKACRSKPKQARRACDKQARKRYGPSKTAKKSSHDNRRAGR